jgi:cell division protein FtsW (lipid II flippase)
MARLLWLVVLLCLLGILVSLGSGLYQLSRGTPEGSAKLVRALTVRISLSIVLFVLLMLAWHFGLIAPHSLQGGAPP